MKEEWTEKLKQKLTGHRKTPPEGLWEGISKQMDFASAPVHQNPEHSLSPFIKRWHWAAAAVLAFAGFFAFHKDNNVKQPIPQQSTSQQHTPQQSERIYVEEDKPLTKKTVPALAQTGKLHKDDNPTKPEPTIQNDETDSDAPLINEQKPTPMPTSKGLSTESDISVHHDNTDPVLPSSHPGSTRKWSVGVNASSGLLASHTSQQMERPYQYNTASSDIGGITTYTPTDIVAEHHIPIRFGLSLQYQVTPRIALLSGINYTYLYSQIRILTNQNNKTDQKLHYIGIPLGASYQLWTTNRFRFYISGSVMLEKCLHSTRGNVKLDDKPWQWSVDAAAGAEYAITRQLGFFLEPSLGYYFDDGTSLEHYYKEHHWTPTVEFGVRLHLNP